MFMSRDHTQIDFRIYAVLSIEKKSHTLVFFFLYKRMMVIMAFIQVHAASYLQRSLTILLSYIFNKD